MHANVFKEAWARSQKCGRTRSKRPGHDGKDTDQRTARIGPQKRRQTCSKRPGYSRKNGPKCVQRGLGNVAKIRMNAFKEARVRSKMRMNASKEARAKSQKCGQSCSKRPRYGRKSADERFQRCPGTLAKIWTNVFKDRHNMDERDQRGSDTLAKIRTNTVAKYGQNKQPVTHTNQPQTDRYTYILFDCLSVCLLLCRLVDKKKRP